MSRATKNNCRPEGGICEQFGYERVRRHFAWQFRK